MEKTETNKRTKSIKMKILVSVADMLVQIYIGIGIGKNIGWEYVSVSAGPISVLEYRMLTAEMVDGSISRIINNKST